VDGLARSIRLVTGLGMIAAGSSLAAPAGVQVAAWWRLQRTAEVGGSRPLGSPAVGLPAGGSPTIAATAAGADDVGPAAGVTGVWAEPRAEGRATLDRHYVPPPPPGPLPGAPAGLTAAGPDLSGHYRTTLAVPPPPLLDGQRPPPLAVGWSARGGDAAAAFQRPAPPPAATYRVRDGDDLTTIATRFYGTPAAAAAIWEANRGVLRDPGLLPIGGIVMLPDPAQVQAVSGRDRVPSIEPPAGTPPVARPASAAAARTWLEGG